MCESKVLLTTYERGEEHPFGISPPYRPCYTEQYKNTPLVPPLLLGLLIIKRGNVFPLLFFPAKCQIERTRTSFSPPPAFITSPPCSSLLPPPSLHAYEGPRHAFKQASKASQSTSILFSLSSGDDPLSGGGALLHGGMLCYERSFLSLVLPRPHSRSVGSGLQALVVES